MNNKVILVTGSSRGIGANLILFSSILILLLIGIYSKIHQGIFKIFIRWYLGDIVFTIAACLIIFSIKQTRKYPLRISIFIFSVFSFLEFIQLWNVNFLNIIRKNYLGMMIFGVKFNWTDFICYLAGSIIAFYWMKYINSIEEKFKNNISSENVD